MTAQPSLLAGDIALVTGASSGLGARFARLLAAHGAHVVALARRTGRLAELVAEIEDAGGAATAIACDVADAAAITAAVEECVARVGVPTILVNNAGVPDAKRAHRMPLEVVDAVIDTNLRGPWLLSTAVAARLIEAGRPGRIVNVSSMAAFVYTGGAAALYSTTKAAVNRMTEALAVEWSAHRINVNAIAPGVFASEMTDGMIERIGDPSGAFPRRRIGVPEQLDSTLLYLVSPASECVTGTVIRVDDGQLPR